jgi:hypothetical protein
MYTFKLAVTWHLLSFVYYSNNEIQVIYGNKSSANKEQSK